MSGNKQDRELLASIMKSMTQPFHEELIKVGIELGKLYTNHGYPIDMALDKLQYTKDQKISILQGVGQWLIEHKRNSGATDKAIDKQRAINRRMTADFIKTGETGIY